MIVRVLSIAGSDPSGGAGIQADLKSFAAHGAYGMAAIASLTAQNTHGVRSVFTPPADFLTQQLEAISDDIVIDATKIGMLGTACNITAVIKWLAAHRPDYVVLDPVMVATSGDRLLDADAERALQALLPLADIITPNVAELAVLVGDRPADDLDAAITQGRKLAALTGARVLVKGGHLPASTSRTSSIPLGEPPIDAVDALVDPDGTAVLIHGPRVDTPNTHGTGCSLSSALAALRPQRGSWALAAIEAKAWLSGALLASDQLDVGTGAGPIHHLHHLAPARPQRPVSTTKFSDGLWHRIAGIRVAIETMPFIRDLADGSLPWPNFRFYLAQDAWYLREYARCLARVAALAPDQDAQQLFARASAGALEAELSLHRSLLADHGESLDGVQVSPVTAAYVDHLHRACATGDYPEAIAAVLPCFWLYQHIGERLAELCVAPNSASLRGNAAHPDVASPRDTGAHPDSAHSDAAHPYAAWIQTYADPEFAQLTAAAISFTDRAAAGASDRQLDVMTDAFVRSSRYEWMFFAQGTDMPCWPV